VVEIFTVLGEAHSGEALVIEGAVIAAAQVAVATKDQLGGKLAKIIGFTDGIDVSGQQAGGGIILSAHGGYAAKVGLGGGRGNALREHPHPVAVLQRIARGTIAADDIVIQHSLQLPALLFGHLGEVRAAVESLFFSGNGEKNDGGGKLVL